MIPAALALAQSPLVWVLIVSLIVAVVVVDRHDRRA